MQVANPSLTPSSTNHPKHRVAASIRDRFRTWGEWTANAIGTPTAFIVALATVLIWAVSGPIFGFSDTWQLVINTGTTIITFLIVFLIQSTQNTDTRILNLKLDELLRALEGARTEFVGLNQMTEDELEEVAGEFSRLAARFGPLVNDDLANVHRELADRRTKQKRA